MAIALISVAYLMGAAALASRRAPWNDEGWFAEPAYTLLTKGYMGSPIIHPGGTWLAGELTGIQTHTYWIIPGSPLLQAFWYRIFGFGVLQMRAISISAGFVVIWTWAFLVWRVTRNGSAAYVAAAVLALDVTFLYGASDGRMDMTTAAFGALGPAIYVWLRELNLTLALIGANTLIAAAILCHPNGVIYGFLLLLLVTHYDVRTLRWRHLLCLAPYFIFIAAWAIYILQQPAYFAAQLRANAATPMGDRAAGLRNPLNAIIGEFKGRYMDHFGGTSVWAQLPRLMRIVPFLYWGCLLWLIAQGVLKKNRSYLLVGLCTAATLLFMSVFVALKAANYLVAILPLYAASAALAARPEPKTWAGIPMSMVTILLITQALGSAIVLHRNEYRDGYVPAASYLKEHASLQTLISGSPGLRFALPAYRLISDSRLHDPAEYIVVDRWYRFDWDFVYRTFEPQTAVEVERKLQMYEQMFDQGGWTILRRRSSLSR